MAILSIVSVSETVYTVRLSVSRYSKSPSRISDLRLFSLTIFVGGKEKVSDSLSTVSPFFTR